MFVASVPPQLKQLATEMDVLKETKASDNGENLDVAKANADVKICFDTIGATKDTIRRIRPLLPASPNDKQAKPKRKGSKDPSRNLKAMTPDGFRLI